MADGIQLVEFLTEHVQFDSLEDAKAVEAKLREFRIPLAASDVVVKRAANAVQKLIFRLPKVSKGHSMRPYCIVLDALPGECKQSKLILETHLVGVDLLAYDTSCCQPSSLEQVYEGNLQHAQGCTT